MEFAKARKNSTTSSMPPSRDFVNPPKSKPGNAGKDRLKRGGHPGQPRHERPPLPPEVARSVHEHRLEACPDCGCTDLLPPASGPRFVHVQQLLLDVLDEDSTGALG